MSIVDFGLMAIGIFFLTEVAGKFFAKKVEKSVIAFAFGAFWTGVGIFTGSFSMSAETVVTGILAVVLSGVVVDKLINPILAKKKEG